MENSTSCAFFSVIRIAHTEWVKKELDLQQNSLISGCTCSTICTSFLFFAFASVPPNAALLLEKYRLFHIFLLPLLRFRFLFRGTSEGQEPVERGKEISHQ
jgi:hypothetical protein